jgi:hypothetical protein
MDTVNLRSVLPAGNQFKRGVVTMIKKLLFCICAVAVLGFAGIVIADNGPAEMVLQTEIDKAKKPKPAVFPHAKHQGFAACSECHHGAENGKQVPYTEGMAIGKFESCHNSGVEGLPKDLASFKDAAHKNCKDCHKKAKEENPALAEVFKGCKPCHQ